MTDPIIGAVSEIVPVLDAYAQHGMARITYLVMVRLENIPEYLQADTPAKVCVDIINRDDAICVPAKSVSRWAADLTSLSRDPGGGLEIRDVTLGYVADDTVEVKEGIRGGEQIVLEPARLVDAR